MVASFFGIASQNLGRFTLDDFYSDPLLSRGSLLPSLLVNKGDHKNVAAGVKKM